MVAMIPSWMQTGEEYLVKLLMPLLAAKSRRHWQPHRKMKLAVVLGLR
jgi:hypothetical protein